MYRQAEKELFPQPICIEEISLFSIALRTLLYIPSSPIAISLHIAIYYV